MISRPTIEPATLSYAALSAAETFRRAYLRVAANNRRNGATQSLLSAEDLLGHLRSDLRSRTYRPGESSGHTAEDAEAIVAISVRDRVVQAALADVLAPVFPPDLSFDPTPEKAAAWVARSVGRRLIRVYATDLAGCFHACGDETILKLAGSPGSWTPTCSTCSGG